MKLTVGLVTRPGTSRANKTGDWRVRRPVFLHKTCTGCQLCQLCCPEGVVFGVFKTFDCDYDYCKGCGICAQVCPAHDIEMKLEGE